MSNQQKSVNPNMVILGRESRGLSQKQLADQLSVTQGRISKIEMGLLAVQDKLLEELSRVLNYPKQFFLQEGSLMGVGIAEIFHRKRQDVPKGVLTKIYAQMEIRLRHIAILLRATEIPDNVHRFDIDEYNGDVAEIARLVRATWEVKRGPIENLTKIVENAGVLVISMDFGTSRVDAISRWVPGYPPLLFVNTYSPKDRYRYSLAHELGHIVMHTIPNPNIEEQANQFAAEFLLPEREIKASLRNLNIAQLAKLKRYWKVSMAAILVRAQTLDMITANHARYLWMQMAKAGYKTREPIELDIEGEQPSLLEEIIETHRKDLGYSIADLSESLLLSEDEVWTLYLRGHDQPSLRIIQNQKPV